MIVNARNIAKFPSNSIECQLERFIREKKEKIIVLKTVHHC